MVVLFCGFIGFMHAKYFFVWVPPQHPGDPSYARAIRLKGARGRIDNKTLDFSSADQGQVMQYDIDVPIILVGSMRVNARRRMVERLWALFLARWVQRLLPVQSS